MATWGGRHPRFQLTQFVILWLAIGIVNVSALEQLYCSSQNTGSIYQNVYIYQSNGECFDLCKSSYAFAIVQYQECWCSNYYPASTVSTDSCNQPCPGFPDESCGSRDEGLFGYIALPNKPSGTAAASGSPSEQVVSSQSYGAPFSSSSPPIPVSVVPASTSSSTTVPGSFISLPSLTSSTFIIPLNVLLTSLFQSSVPDPSPVTVHQTFTASPSIRISLITLTPATKPTSSTSPSFTTSTSSDSISEISTEPVAETSTPITVAGSSKTPTWSATPFASVITVTGQVKTITITPAIPTQPTQTPESPAAGQGLAVPKIIGLAVGLVSGFSIVVVMALWWYYLRRKRRESNRHTNRAGEGIPQRRPSRLSQMGLVNETPQTAADRRIPRIQTSGWGPSTNAEKSPSDANTPMDLRSSYPRIVDQRLDPVALWNPLHDNGSHVSVKSFQDDQDYSRRMLRIANPDEY